MSCEKQLYIVLSQTGTIISRMLKVFTRAEYNHVSISLTSDLEQMYSFGRKKAYMPFPGGMVKESVDSGVFKRFEDTKSVIIAVDIDDDKYCEICEYIGGMYMQKNIYHYNYLGVLFAAANKEFKRENRFYCSEFVKHVLQQAGAQGVEELDEIVHPMDFFVLPHEEVYSGVLKEYCVN